MTPVRAYRITARIHNNRVWRAILERWPDVTTQTEAARRLGMRAQDLNAVLTMRVWPWSEAKGGWSAMARHLSDQLAEQPEVLFDRGLYGRRAHPIVVEADRPSLPAPTILALEDPERRPDEILEAKQLSEQMGEVLKTLTAREEKVLRLRFGIDGSNHTLEEISQQFDVSPARIRQIEAKALRKLRHPTHSKKLKRFFEA